MLNVFHNISNDYCGSSRWSWSLTSVRGHTWPGIVPLPQNICVKWLIDADAHLSFPTPLYSHSLSTIISLIILKSTPLLILIYSILQRSATNVQRQKCVTIYFQMSINGRPPTRFSFRRITMNKNRIVDVWLAKVSGPTRLFSSYPHTENQYAIALN